MGKRRPRKGTFTCEVIRQTCELVIPPVMLLERGTPEQVRAEVQRQIRETRAQQTGGLFVVTSSEINPPIPPENFRAMLEAVWQNSA